MDRSKVFFNVVPRVLFVVLLMTILTLAGYEAAVSVNVSYVTLPNATTVDHADSRAHWITELFSDAEKNFRIADTVNAKCKRDFDLYKLHARNQSVWAVRMLESSEWPSVGLFSGTINHMGNWFECTRVSKHDVVGKYCLVSAAFKIPENLFVRDSPQWPDESASAWNVLKEFQQLPWKSNRQAVRWGLCVPASCQPTDLQVSLAKTLNPVFNKQGIDVTVSVDAKTCSTSQENWWKDYELGYNLFWIFTKIIIASMVFSTVYHYFSKPEDLKPGVKGLVHEIIMSFSVIRNYAELTYISKDDIPCLYFAKIIYMFFIVLGHRIIFFYSYPFYNPEAIETELYTPGSVMIGLFYCGFIMVEIFFFFSGFISFSAHLAKTKAKGWLAAVEDLLYRWARMIPAHIYSMLIMIYVLPRLSDGPLWYRTRTEAERCKSSLWANFFAVSNLVGTDKMCLFHSWYPSADIQLTIIGSIILLVYAKNEKLGIWATVATFLYGTIYTFYHTYVHQYHGVMPVFVSTIYTARNTDEFLNSYISTSTRIASYIVGFGIAIITKKLFEIKFKVSEGNIFFIFVMVLCSKVAIILYLPRLCAFAKQYDRLENAVTASVIRSIFVFPEAVLSATYVLARKCKYLLFFDSNVWVPLGRLLYGVFVISVVIQLFHSASHHVLMPSYSLVYIFWLSVSDVVFSIIGAFALYLMIQAPIFNVLKIFIRLLMRRVYLAFGVGSQQLQGKPHPIPTAVERVKQN